MTAPEAVGKSALAAVRSRFEAHNESGGGGA
jgi:hypothetical protein